MAPDERRELRAKSHKLGKTIAAVRFAIRHAGTGRAGAPAKALTKERRKEMEDRIKVLEAERTAVRARLAEPAKEKKPTAAEVVDLAKAAATKAAKAKKSDEVEA